MKTNNSSFLSEAAGDEKKAEWLEYNLKLIPETVEKTKAQVAARGAKILSYNITINGYDSMTAELCTQVEANPGTEKVRKELEERLEKRKEEKKAEKKADEEKAAEKRADKRWLCILFGIPYEAEYQGEGTGSALHIYNEEGEEVLTYTQGVGWHEKETKAETGVHSALKLAYYEAYHDARKALNTGTNVEITNENVVVQSNFDMKA